MFDSIKRLFAPKAPDDSLWKVQEEMDPLLSFKRFQALKLTRQQRPLVQGLIDGTVAPGTIEAVRDWATRNGESDDGIDALVFALQHVMESPDVTYLFENQVAAPAARFPCYVSEREMAVVFNDQKFHLQITSLEEFVTSNDISDYALEALTLAQFRLRMINRLKRYHGITASPADDEPKMFDGKKLSVTIEKHADADERLPEPVGEAEVASAMNAEGFNVTADDIRIEIPLEKLGLHKVRAQLATDTNLRVFVWVVPAAESLENET